MIPPTIRIGDRDFEVLAISERGDRTHRVLKGHQDSGYPFVVKTYGLKRARGRTAIWWFGHRILVGKSSVTVKGRYRTEREVLELWRQHGLHVPQLIDIELPQEFPRPFLAMEWIGGGSLAKRMASSGTTLDEKKVWTRRLAEALGHRHELALCFREPRLIHEHPRLDHLLVDDDRLVTHDFEIVYTRRHRIQDLISQELAGFLKSLSQVGGKMGEMSNADDIQELFAIFIESYPAPDRLRALDDSLARGSLPGLNLLHRWDARKRRKSPRSKFAIAHRITEMTREA